MDEFTVSIPHDFPIDDVIELATRLHDSGAVVPGFIPSPYGPLDFMSVEYQGSIDGFSFTLLPDRNIVSRMAKLAKIGAAKMDATTQIAADLMAYSQAMNFLIEPSLAFHELAHLQGNEVAHDELTWFRAADRGGYVHQWIDLAMGRAKRIRASFPDPVASQDLAYPLSRWRRNYIVTLKIAELELQPLQPLEKVTELLDWMYNDFIVAGPAAVLSTFYFSPLAERRRVIKQLRSSDREAAIRGIKNAAWDITHLSDFVRRVCEEEATKSRYLFVTADKTLAKIAPLLLLPPDDTEDQDSLIRPLTEWWPEATAALIVEKLHSYANKADTETWRRQRLGKGIEDWISEGEAVVRAWRSPMK